VTSAPESASRRWIRTPAILVGIGAAVVLAGAGLAVSRPDIVALAVPPALWTLLVVRAERRARRDPPEIRIQGVPGGDLLADEISIEAEAETVDLLIEQAERRVTRVLVPGRAALTTRSRTRHSGPLDAVRVRGRALTADAAFSGSDETRAVRRRAVPPRVREIRELPLAPRLTGLHGSHEGSRPGHGGDFRDIHPFAPGDELRRVDWRATARAARRPGDLLVRRTYALSDASVVIAMDAADDLGEVVATWGTADRARSGTTSLDHAREAARSLATTAVGAGDRVAYHVLDKAGRSVRGGTGSRHLARVVSAISSTGQAGDDSRYRRTPPVPQGSVIAVLSTFFDGAAADLALLWRASGHRVIAVDTLPELDAARLTPEQRLALRVLLAERDVVFRDLSSAGVDRVRWDDDAATALGALARPRAAR